MGYSFKQRFQIHRRAKRKLGIEQKQDPPDDWMENCIDTLIDDGDAENEDDASEQCQVIWEDQEDDNPF